MDIVTGSVLTVDDNPANLDLLCQLLREHGYKVRAAPSGAMALEAIKAAPPELVLMDISMPVMDGYEACRRIKKDPQSAAIPVIFLSALDHPIDKIKAFQAGGSDYVAKPFQEEEVLARVSHHIQLARIQTFMEDQNRLLSEANAKLREMDNLKIQFSTMLIHDLREPVSLMGLAMEIYRQQGTMPPEVSEGASLAIRKCSSLLNSFLELAAAELVDDQLILSELEPGVLLDYMVKTFGPKAHHQGLAFHTEWPDALPTLHVNPQKLERVLANLLGNALKFTPQGGTVTLSAEIVHGSGLEEGLRWLCLKVADTGLGIPSENLPFVFDPIHPATFRAQGGGTGLGLAIANRFVAAHRGRITVQSKVGAGTVFSVFLPLGD